ncbi:glycosyltransferase family 2 protein [Anaerotignum lactatifermentans]|uniref:glycosyltransferase family 2 protein n=1 Tax=Anaerotignum lactatifermentans TaxID=160404 RepID=UPI003AF14BE5
MEGMTFRWQTDWFRDCMPLFSCLLEGAERIAAGNAGDFGKMGDWLGEIENICDSVEELKNCHYAGQMMNVRSALLELTQTDRKAELASYTLLPFLWELREEIYFWGCVAEDIEKRQVYWQEEFVSHHRRVNPRRIEQKKVTIFIPACNHLDYTKQCVESVLRHTDLRECELLLLDHGSRDETAAYFHTIPNAKVIRFRENVGMLMFSVAFRACCGRYLAFVSNDTIVTEGWLSHLLDCLEREENALSATPVTPFTSNCQGIAPCPLEGLEDFAKEFYEKGKWRHRARIMPVIGVYDVEKLDKMGFGDRWFQTMEFWDDDVSLRARRKGFRQFLCTDVYCHHFGSVTGGVAWGHTLTAGRELFLQKHGVDAWGQGFCRSEDMMALLPEMELPETSISFLAVDCGFGDSIFEVQNYLKEQRKQVQTYALSEVEGYRGDVFPFVQGWHTAVEGTAAALTNAFAERRFSLILTEKSGLSGEILAERLLPGGYVLAMDSELTKYLRLAGRKGHWSLWQKI